MKSASSRRLGATLHTSGESPTASEALNGGTSFTSTFSDKDIAKTRQSTAKPAHGTAHHRHEQRRAAFYDSALEALGSAGTGDELALTSELFATYDRNNDGKLSYSECAPMLRAIGAASTEAELQAMFKDINTNGDSSISFPELAHFVRLISKPLSRDDELMEAYKFFAPTEELSESRSVKFTGGGITKHSLAVAFASIGEHVSEEECASMIAGASHGQETLDVESFLGLCKPVSRPRTGDRGGSKTTLPA
mmetsp:Transcript_22226/g.40922  ORF Transcript_22226/g.40922 Transcript_22226/m.40922 type:complete len:251 (+) Transcript_22226:65-817(+)